MSFEIKISADSAADLDAQIRSLAAHIGASEQTAQKLGVADIPMNDIVEHLRTQGFVIMQADPVVANEVIELESKRQRRAQEPAPAPAKGAADEDLKTRVVAHLQRLYVDANGGADVVNRIRKTICGNRRFSEVPADRFPVIVEALRAEGRCDGLA